MSEPYYRLIQQQLAEAVRRRRKQLHLTQEDAAQAMNMAPRHLQKLEAGEVNVTLRTLARVAKALDMNLSDLFQGPRTKDDDEST